MIPQNMQKNFTLISMKVDKVYFIMKKVPQVKFLSVYSCTRISHNIIICNIYACYSNSLKNYLRRNKQMTENLSIIKTELNLFTYRKRLLKLLNKLHPLV